MMNPHHPKLIGDRACAIVMARLIQIYEAVLLPFGENQRYDLVIETDDGFLRVQCKTGRLRGGAIRFPCCSVTYEHASPRKGFSTRDYRGAADLFGVYCPETDGVYLVPVECVGRNSGYLRVEPTKNNQAQGIRWASDYEVKAGLAQRQSHALVMRRRWFDSGTRLFN